MLQQQLQLSKMFCTLGWLIAYATAWQTLEARAMERPNVILVITDDQGYGALGRHGNSWIRTPNLDQLHDSSLRFERFLVSPTCSPTRAAIMTGRHPMKNGITHTILERERMTLEAITLPQVLQRAGYRTGIFGKWHLGDEDAYQPQQRGFDEAFIHGGGGIGQAYDCSCADAPNNSYFDPIIRHNGQFQQTKGFCTDVFFDAALGWIQQQVQDDVPYFAYIATNAPHAPYFAPAANVDRFVQLGFDKNSAGFYGMIENIDENLGRLSDYLTQHHQWEKTLVIFMSDNGMAQEGYRKGQPLGKTAAGDPLRGWNADMKGLKNSPDEGGVRVPFFLRWDGQIAAGVSIEQIAAHIDIMPTLAELCGASLPENGQVEGRSLRPLIEAASGRKAIEAEKWTDRYLFTHVGRWPSGADVDQYRDKGYAVRSQQYRLVNGELFDMQNDPNQTMDISSQHPDVVAAMKTAFNEFWESAKPLMVNETAPLSKKRPFWEAFEQQKSSHGIPSWKVKH